MDDGTRATGKDRGGPAVWQLCGGGTRSGGPRAAARALSGRHPRSGISAISRCGRSRRWRPPTSSPARTPASPTRLLDRYGIRTPLTPYHDHNAQAARPKILARIRDGGAVALVSDAGTPLISDPGYGWCAPRMTPMPP